MAPEDNAGTELLLQGFERRFLAARTLRSFPWQSLEAKLRDSSDSELLRDILHKTVKHPVCVKHPPSVKYARCFLSELIKKHEAVHTEPLDELYEALAETLMAKESTQGHRSPREARSHCPRAQPSSPTVPQAWSHGTPPSTLQNGPSRTRQPSLTDVLYCPEAIVSLVGVLRRLAACQEHKRAPEVYVAFTVCNPETCQLFTTELGRAGMRWEAEAHHDHKLFPYREHLEMAMLNLTL
nr:protein-lysine N-methyltransferase EEF2KMT isoform X5 [Gorilla gorilla gorilla]